MRMPCILQRVGGSTWETLENVILSVKSLVMYYCNFSCLFLLSFKQFHLYATHIWTPDHHLEIFFCTLKCPQRRTVHTVVEWYCICTHNVLILQATGQSEPPPPHTHTSKPKNAALCWRSCGKLTEVPHWRLFEENSLNDTHHRGWNENGFHST